MLRLHAVSSKKVLMTVGQWVALGVTVALVALAGVVVSLLIWESTKPVPMQPGASADIAVMTPHRRIG